MKKVFVLSIGLLFFASCERDIVVSENEGINLDQSSSARGADKVDVCHKGGVISVSINALGTHQAHGDAVDMDGDGYFNIENNCSEVDCDDESFSENNSCGPAEIGALRAGGIVFWVAPDNTHGLVCALADAPERLNWNDAVSYSNAYANGGTGANSDWYLPSEDELQLMYANLERFECTTNTPGGTDPDLCGTRIGDFVANTYWSSTESGFFVRAQSFDNGAQGDNFKSDLRYVRAVKAF